MSKSFKILTGMILFASLLVPGAAFAEVPDYSLASNWLDGFPAINASVDTIFFSTTGAEDTKLPDIVSYDNEPMRKGVALYTFNNASPFLKTTNCFIPFYSQSHLRNFVEKTQAEMEEFEKGRQFQDACAALDYYFENLNGGRPFILAGHSQGSLLLKIILSDYMKLHPEYYSRMVAAYVVGYSVTKEDLKKNPHWKFAAGSGDVGVVISWNTEGPANKNAKNLVVLDGAISINPMNWKRDETPAPASENLGSFAKISSGLMYSPDEKFTKENLLYPSPIEAQLDTERGVVVCRAGDIKLMPTFAAAFGPEGYHADDYAYFFGNICENIKLRTQNWYKLNKGINPQEIIFAD